MSKTQEKADVKMNDFEGVNMIMYQVTKQY